jgi:hypothetical protein
VQLECIADARAKGLVICFIDLARLPPHACSYFVIATERFGNMSAAVFRC